MKSILTILLALLERVVLIRVPSSSFEPHTKGIVKFSALMVGIKGKVGGTVFQGSKAGPSIKNKPNGNFVKAIKWIFGVPNTQVNWGNSYANLLSPGQQILSADGSNTNTGFNRSAQALITRTSKAWGQLSQEVRSAWTASAPNFPFTNKWGDPYTGSGFQVFMSINNKIMALGAPMLTMPPSPDDGVLATYNWNEISVALEASSLNIFQIIMAFTKPKEGNTSVSLCKRIGGHAGSTKVVFGCSRFTATNDNSTFELLPISEMMGLNIQKGGLYMIDVEIVNIENGHTLYSASYPTSIPILPSNQLFQWVYSGIYNPAPDLALEPALDWSMDALVIECGNITVDHDSPLVGHILRLLQLTSNETITFTVGGTNPANFYFLLGSSVLTSASPTNLNANVFGSFGNEPLITNFTPDTSGPFSATLTISSVSLSAPIVININGTGV